jgi:cobalt-zinc-cadmium efflux system protein
MLLTGGFMAVEAAGGLLAGSLALLADAVHMLTDAAALCFAWLAFRLARRPADPQRSYGYHRFQVLAAFVNGVVLIAIVVWIVIEAVERLREPVEILGGLMLAVAAVGLVANVIAFAILHGGNRENLNVRGALLHVLGDLLGSLAAMVAAMVIIVTGWTPIDPILSMLVALLILRSAWALVRQSTHVLLEGTPTEIDVPRLKSELVDSVPEVDDVHHVHVWTLASGKLVMTLHAHVRDDVDTEQVLRRIVSICHERFGVTHVTVQIEHGHCADVA